MPAPTFALIIGIDDYTVLDRSLGRPLGSNDLRGALNDVAAMTLLVRTMDVPAENIRVLTTPPHGPNAFNSVAVGRYPVPGATAQPTFTAAGHDALRPIKMEMSDATFGYATRQEILGGLAWLARKLEESPGSNGIVYFSGHSFITEQGHLCLCPSDTLKGEAPEPVVDVVCPDAVNGYLRWVAYLSALDEVIGSDDPARLLQLTEELRRRFTKGCDPGELVRKCANKLGLPVSDDGVRKFVQDVPVGRGGDAADQLEWILERGELTEETIASIVRGDPFADACEYRNLISFNKAFFQMLRDVPADRSIHVLLDTCMSSPTGAQLHRQYLDIDGSEVVDGETIWRTGIPQANGNMMMLLSSRPESTSYRAVFDNRWYGAFTWALVTLLGRVPVLVTDQGRYFDVTYGALCDQIKSLLGVMSCAQKPEAWTGNWDGWSRGSVFGTLQERAEVEQTLLPVRVKEEIDAGTTGCIYQIHNRSSHLGYLIVIPPGTSFTVNGHTWDGSTTGREYWIWDTTAFPRMSFTLDRPQPASLPAPTSLAGWIGNLTLDPSNAKVCSSGSFPTTTSQDPVLTESDNIYQINKIVGETTNSLGWMVARTDNTGTITLIWKAGTNAPLSNNQFNFAGGNLILPSTTMINFVQNNAPSSASGIYKVLTDTINP